MPNNSNYVVEDAIRDSEHGKIENSGRQFASGGAPGMEMVVPPSAHQDISAELSDGTSDQQDFLMISSFPHSRGEPITRSR